MFKILDDKYKLFKLRKLGIGAFSTVYKGENIKTKEIVAIKEINISDSKDNKKNKFLHEINIMKLIKSKPHPNIINCYDIINDLNNYIYIIMEYCTSGTLESIIGKPIKEEFVQYYFNQLNNGLKYLRDNDITHRDIKPSNILLTDKFKVLKIADFGLSKENIYDTYINMYCGSPLYMAPELIGKQKYITQSDLWSIGLILYEMIYGTHPFKKCNDLKDLIKTIKKINIIIPPPKNTNNDISQTCIKLMKKLLEKNQKNRISWNDFYNHTWLNVFQNDLNNELNNYIQHTVKDAYNSDNSSENDNLVISSKEIFDIDI